MTTTTTTLRPFRVYLTTGQTQDCTLHPDGRMTMQAGGETLTSMLSLDDMLAMDWAEARIEWDPAPAAETPAAPESAQLDLSGGAL